MICPKCNRLCPDTSVICPHCSEVFDADRYVESLQESEPDVSVRASVLTENDQQSNKYFKWGWTLIVGFIALIVGCVLLFLNVTDPAKAVADEYAEAFYNGNFQGTAMSSAVNLEKCYNAQAKNNQFDFFGFFSSGYSSYEEMMSAYADAFTKNKEKISSIYGNDYDVKFHFEKQVKLNEATMFNIIKEYTSAYGDILRDGEITGMRYVYATVGIEGSDSAISEIIQYIVVEIDSQWYVLTDDSLDFISNVR